MEYSAGSIKTGSMLSVAKIDPEKLARPPTHAVAYVRDMIKRMHQAKAAGMSKKFEYLAVRYLQSSAARLVATFEANRKLKPHRRVAVTGLSTIASKLNAFEGTDEAVALNFKPKKSNPCVFRHTMNFGICNRALHELVKPVLSVIANLHADQFATKGLHKAIERAAEAVADGYVWGFEIDIADCYPSFDAGKLAELIPLPKKVVENVLTSTHLNLTPGNITTWFPADEGDEDLKTLFASDFAGAQRGIPQGSAASPLLVEVLLAPVFAQLPKGGVAIGYSDNTLLLGKNEEEAVSMAKTLRSALVAHPAGHFEPTLKEFKGGTPIEFLGHRIARTKGGSVRIEVSPDNRHKFRKNLKTRIHSIEGKALSPSARKKKVREAKSYVSSWCAAFKLCKGVDLMRKKALLSIATAAKSKPS